MSKERAAWTTHDKTGTATCIKADPLKRSREGVRALERGYKTERLTGQTHSGLTRRLCENPGPGAGQLLREAEIRKSTLHPLKAEEAVCTTTAATGQHQGTPMVSPSHRQKLPKLPFPLFSL